MNAFSVVFFVILRHTVLVSFYSVLRSFGVGFRVKGSLYVFSRIFGNVPEDKAYCALCLCSIFLLWAVRGVCFSTIKVTC